MKDVLMTICKEMHTKIHDFAIAELNIYIIPTPYFFHHVNQGNIVKIEKSFLPI